MADSADAIFDKAEESLKTAYYGLNLAKQREGQTKVIGLRNAITFARPVTDILEDAKPLLGPEYDAWYQDKLEFMTEDDEVCQALGTIRNQLVHDGEDDLVPYTKVDHFSSHDIQRLMPPWADSFFLGDQYGGDGFTVQLSNGDTRKFYIDLPDDIRVESGVQFSTLDTPGDAEDDVEYYVKVMAELVADARHTFGTT